MPVTGEHFMRKINLFKMALLIAILFADVVNAETHWAVLVGIDKYQSQEISSLKGAANDARSLAEVLKKEMQFPEKNVFLFTSDSPSHLQPTTGNVVRGLKYVAEKAQPADTFILFFSGHGVTSGSKGYLLTQQSDLGAVQFTALPLAELSQLVDSVKARRKLLLVDACRNDPEVGRGDAPNRLSTDFTRGISVRPMVLEKKTEYVWATLFSCEEGQRAYEWPERNRGFFTYYLEKGLKGDAVDSSGRVTLASLVSYLRRVVPEEVQRYLGVDKRQVPWVRMEGADPGNWVIVTFRVDKTKEIDAKKKELGALEREYGERKAKEDTEIAKQEAELKKLDDQVAELKKRLGTPLAKGGDLDAMLAMVKQKEEEQKRLDELRRQKELEERKRKAEIDRLKAEQRKKLILELKEDIRKYKEIVSSPFGKDLKDAAWKTLASKYPEAAEGVSFGDADQLLFKGQFGSLSPSQTNSIGMKFALIRPGKFMMGNSGGSEDEQPPHEVEITEPFYLGQYEVTQGQWKAIMGNNPSYFMDCGDNCPVESVSWNDVQEFIQKLNQIEGVSNYRLPTEAEWEYVCRAGDHGDGPDRLGDYAWYSGNSGGRTHPVGQKKQNLWGLYDMHGNVWEWCQDWYERDYYMNSPKSDPRGSSNGQFRVLRGGSWFDGPGVMRASGRTRNGPTNRSYADGFRLVLSSE
jgi:formylglycine-generating enzyme required for sulfatase activity